MVSENIDPNSPYVISSGHGISEAYPPGALEHLQQADPVLERLIRHYGLITRAQPPAVVCVGIGNCGPADFGAGCCCDYGAARCLISGRQLSRRC